MKKRMIAGTLMLGALLAFGGAQLRAADTLVGPLQKQWDVTKGLVMGMVNAVPEDKWDYKPTPEVRSFRDQFTHLISENYMYMAMVAGDAAPDRKKFEALKSKDEIVKTLGESYEYGAKALAALTPEKAMEMIDIRGNQTPRWAAALLNLTDNMDHYGNLVVYVRLNGMTPPRSVRPTPPPAK